MQCADHLPKLGDLTAAVARRRVAVVRGEVPDRLVAPVVTQPACDQLGIVHELVHRKQLDGGHSEPLQVRDRGGMPQPGITPAQRVRHVGMQLGEAFHVDLVEDRVGHRPSRAFVPVPVELTGDHE